MANKTESVLRTQLGRTLFGNITPDHAYRILSTTDSVIGYDAVRQVVWHIISRRQHMDAGGFDFISGWRSVIVHMVSEREINGVRDEIAHKYAALADLLQDSLDAGIEGSERGT